MKNIFFALYQGLSKKNKTATTEAFRHAKKGWKRRSTTFSLSNTILVLTLLFLFAPLIYVVIFSFNSSKGQVFTNFSFKWYKELIFNSDKLWQALFNSLIIALTSSVVSTILGSAASIGINWYRFRGKTFIQTLTYLPLVLPEVIVGISTLIFFGGIKVPLGLFTIFAAHTTFCLPFVFLMVNARLEEFDYSTVEAGRDLGATEGECLKKVLLPYLMPGILSGFMIAITMSLEDFVITYFVGGPGSTTLPVYIYSSIKYGVSPVISCLSCLLIFFTCIIAIVLRRALKVVAQGH